MDEVAECESLYTDLDGFDIQDDVQVDCLDVLQENLDDLDLPKDCLHAPNDYLDVLMDALDHGVLLLEEILEVFLQHSIVVLQHGRLDGLNVLNVALDGQDLTGCVLVAPQDILVDALGNLQDALDDHWDALHD